MYSYTKVLKDHNITVAEIARRLNRKPMCIHEVLKAGSQHINQLADIAEVMGADVAEFFLPFSYKDPRLEGVLHQFTHFSYNYKRVLAAHGVTAYDVAKLLGCTPQNVYQRLKKNPLVSSLQKIADAIGADVAEFFLPFTKDDPRIAPILHQFG